MYVCMQYVCMNDHSLLHIFMYRHPYTCENSRGDELLFDVDLAAIEHFPSAGDRGLYAREVVPRNIIILLCYV
jgi:hypothetical protein